ncbi:hypothetical protein G6F40_014418 [Rhizopus arrhizus]|nr:hypothetical protein G6F40_014418 [Rhizopus arrhizus]
MRGATATTCTTAATHGRATPLLAPSALEALAQYAFPGNVRELENILERALALAEEDCIGADDLRLPQHAPRAPGSAAPAEAVADLQPGSAALPSYIEQLERSAIQRARDENRWDKTRTAAQRGITFRALRYKLKKLGMDAGRWPATSCIAASTHGVDLPQSLVTRLISARLVMPAAAFFNADCRRSFTPICCAASAICSELPPASTIVAISSVIGITW